MSDTRSEVELGVRGALSTLLERDEHLLRADVAERSVCAQLARYLRKCFPKYDVDVEYNRHGIDPKRLKGLDCGKTDLVCPDIVVHERGHDEANLLVIEVKKSSNGESRRCDRAKLAGFLDELGYHFAVFVEIPVAHSAGQPPSLDWIGER